MLAVPLKRIDPGVLQAEYYCLLGGCLTWRTLPGLSLLRFITLGKVTV
jgi:hypothetical protein